MITTQGVQTEGVEDLLSIYKYVILGLVVEKTGQTFTVETHIQLMDYQYIFIHSSGYRVKTPSLEIYRPLTMERMKMIATEIEMNYKHVLQSHQA